MLMKIYRCQTKTKIQQVRFDGIWRKLLKKRISRNSLLPNLSSVIFSLPFCALLIECNASIIFPHTVFHTNTQGPLFLWLSSSQIAFLWLNTSPARLVSWMLSTPMRVWNCSTSMCLTTPWWPYGTSSPSRSKAALSETVVQTAMWLCKTVFLPFVVLCLYLARGLLFFSAEVSSFCRAGNG